MTDNKDLNYITKLPETRTQIILNQEQNQPQTEQKSTVKKVAEAIKEVPEIVKENAIPTVYASDSSSKQRENEEREGIERVIGGAIATTDACNPPLGAVATVSSEIVGGVMQGIGQIAGDQGTKEVGETFTNAPARPFKDTKEAFEKK